MNPEYCTAGPYDLRIEEGEWFDAHRSRRLPWRRYHPLREDAAPLVIYSHGLGGSCHSGEAWLNHWATWGIGTLALQHPGTDAAAAGNSSHGLRHLLRIATDNAHLATRQADLCFALDQAERTLPCAAMGMAGHSYGAVSVMRLLGERRGADDIAADPRLSAAILLSPSARGGSQPLGHRFSAVTLPCLHLTGTADDGIGPGDINAEARCLPYLHSLSPDQQLLVLHDAGHLVFAGEGYGTEAQVGLVKGATTAFWLKHLTHNGNAADWLSKTLPARLAALDRLEFR